MRLRPVFRATVACVASTASLVFAAEPPPVIDHNWRTTNGYAPQWADEFEAGAGLNSAWTIRRPGKRNDGYNTMQAVSLTETVLNNSGVNILPDDGLYTGALQLTTSPPGSIPGIPSDLYPTAMLSTHQSTLFTYGYFEASIKVQKSTGHWGAFWMQSEANSANISVTPDNPGGLGTEIDIMEHTIVDGVRKTQHALHWNGYADDHPRRTRTATVDFNPDAFATFGLLWTPEYYAYYINGKLSAKITDGISHAPEYFILSLETGIASFGGVPKPADYPDSMYVDYVRVYQTNRNITAPVGIPEPASLAVVAGAGALLMARRRRRTRG
jgi:beta-glucanase (GH16 family)